jgi:hypothetical protein
MGGEWKGCMSSEKVPKEKGCSFPPLVWNKDMMTGALSALWITRGKSHFKEGRTVKEKELGFWKPPTSSVLTLSNFFYVRKEFLV